MDIKTALYTTTLGVAVADAYGVPYEFRSREQMKRRPASDEMTGGGIHGMPVGTWSDDTSLTLASVDSIIRCGEIDLTDMAQRFANWYDHAAYTADGDVFDIGGTCGDAIDNFISGMDVSSCGLTNFRSNGNGSLMRIAPVAVYCANMPDAEAIEMVHKASAITHAHPISMVGCGIYYFIIKEFLTNSGYGAKVMHNAIRNGIKRAFDFYNGLNDRVGEFLFTSDISDALEKYHRLCDVDKFAALSEFEIESSGYVVHSLEAALWSLLNTDDYKSAVQKAVNLGRDTDTIAAIVGGLAGLCYNLPDEWVEKLVNRHFINYLFL